MDYLDQLNLNVYKENLETARIKLMVISAVGRADISRARMIEMYQGAWKNLETARELAEKYAYLNPDIAKLAQLQHELVGWRIKIGLDKTSAEVELDIWAGKLGLDLKKVE